MDVLNHGGELYRITEAVQETNQDWRVSSGEVPLVSIRLTAFERPNSQGSFAYPFWHQ